MDLIFYFSHYVHLCGLYSCHTHWAAIGKKGLEKWVYHIDLPKTDLNCYWLSEDFAHQNRLSRMSSNQGTVAIKARISHVNLSDLNINLSSQNKEKGTCKILVLECLRAINPFDEWKEHGIMGKAMLILRSPFVLILKIFLPVVDYEREKHGWCKLLHSIQIVIAPSFLIWAICK